MKDEVIQKDDTNNSSVMVILREFLEFSNVKLKNNLEVLIRFGSLILRLM